MIQKKTALALVAAVGSIVLTACAGDGPDQLTSGYLDDVKYVKSVKAVPAVYHYESKKKTQRVCAVRVKGKCSRYEDKTTTTRTKVIDKAGKPGKPALYCVELDAVGGDADANDQWYEVTWKTYAKWSTKDEGVKVGSMKFIRELSACKR